MTRLYSNMMITGLKFFSISLCIRKSRTEWAPVADLAGLLMKSYRERCPSGRSCSSPFCGWKSLRPVPRNIAPCSVLGVVLERAWEQQMLEMCGRESWEKASETNRSHSFYTYFSSKLGNLSFSQDEKLSGIWDGKNLKPYVMIRAWSNWTGSVWAKVLRIRVKLEEEVV